MRLCRPITFTFANAENALLIRCMLIRATANYTRQTCVVSYRSDVITRDLSGRWRKNRLYRLSADEGKRHVFRTNRTRKRSVYAIYVPYFTVRFRQAIIADCRLIVVPSRFISANATRIWCIRLRELSRRLCREIQLSEGRTQPR